MFSLQVRGAVAQLERALISERTKAGIAIDVCSRLHRKARVEERGGFTTCFSNLIGFERTLDHIGNRAVFAPGKPVGQISRLRASNRQLLFSHIVSHIEHPLAPNLG